MKFKGMGFDETKIPYCLLKRRKVSITLFKKYIDGKSYNNIY